MSDDILQIAMTSYYDRTKYAAIPEGMKAAINAVLSIQEHYFIEKHYSVIFSDDNNIVNELRNYLEDRDIQINRIDEDNKRLLKENAILRGERDMAIVERDRMREALKPFVELGLMEAKTKGFWGPRAIVTMYVHYTDISNARAALESVTEKSGAVNE